MNCAFITSYERDNETNLDFAEARYYSNQHGRFTSTDPIIMSFKRAVDPQRINLYAYSRNNPLNYIDPDGEDIEEPNGLSEEDQKAYEKWRDKFLSTEEVRKTWDRYKNDKNFTLKIVVADRGEKNKSAKVDDFIFDADGNFTGATMTLGRNLGKGDSADPERYPIISSILDGSSAEVGASKIAHEFGHLDDFRSMGKTFYEQQQILNQIRDRYDKLSVADYMKDPVSAGLRKEYEKKFGVTTAQDNLNRDLRAEKNAIPTIRQIFGKSLNSKTKKAMQVLEGKPK